MMKFLSNDQPLWLPKGSVRSLLALIITGGYFLDWVDKEIILVVLGFYFVERASSNG